MAIRHEQNRFVPPTVQQRIEALGETDKLNDDIRRALTIRIEDSFPSIPIPNPGDWLRTQDEDGQTVKQFEKSQKTRASPRCNIIYIQPIGDFTGVRSPDLNIICDFSNIFFPGCQTELLSSIDFDYKMKKRLNPFTNQPQYLVPNLIGHLKKLQRKRHNRKELFSIGMTMVDIYPNPQWNFVYGSASIDDGIGIYSFARLDPLFPHSSSETLEKLPTETERILILKRSVSTYLHEVTHLFGLEHCIYYLCLMNGANCENEMDQQLIYLCPICLKKMYLSFGKQNYDIMKIYRQLFELTKRIGFQEEANWYEQRLQILETDS